jgi:hypothetical protein
MTAYVIFIRERTCYVSDLQLHSPKAPAAMAGCVEGV